GSATATAITPIPGRKSGTSTNGLGVRGYRLGARGFKAISIATQCGTQNSKLRTCNSIRLKPVRQSLDQVPRTPPGRIRDLLAAAGTHGHHLGLGPERAHRREQRPLADRL